MPAGEKVSIAEPEAQVGPEGRARRQALPEDMPVLPVPGLVIYPGVLAPLRVGEPWEQSAVDAALASDRLLALTSMRTPEPHAPPVPDDLYQVGTACVVAKMYKLPDGSRSLLLSGVARVRIGEYTSAYPHLAAKVEPLSDIEHRDVETEALSRTVLDMFRQVVENVPQMGGELFVQAMNIEEPGRLADFVAMNINPDLADRQGVLEAVDVNQRLERVRSLLHKELEVLELRSRIQSQATQELDKAQREYILRQQLRAIQKELGETDQQTAEVARLRERVEQAGMSEEAKQLALREIDRLAVMPPQAAEYPVVLTFLDWLLSLPWQVSTEDKLDVTRAADILDRDHYDLQQVKERILEFLSVRKLKVDMKGPILCFVGPPGTGKTSLGKSIAEALGRKFIRISLGGMRDEAEIRGHRRTYVGALPGRIIQGIRRCGSNNPVFMLDEVDKLGMDFRGDPSSALLEVLDPEQNHSFRDHYLEVEFDLSTVMFITTANILETVPPALRDRMEVIRLSGYTEEEKLVIARKYILPREVQAHGLDGGQLTLSDDALGHIISEYTQEAGVRTLERQIAAVCRKVARKIAEGTAQQVAVEANDLPELLGPPQFTRELLQRTQDVGVAVGLAWTPTGGDIMFVECAAMKGKRGLNLTGQLGEVMQESGEAALSYVRSHAAQLGVPEDFFEHTDLHIHVPEGATPKDGPSAGIALAAAVVSRLTKRHLKPYLAMTGELTLQGRVLPVGGIKEKVLAARRAGVKTVILPRRNEVNLQDIPEELRQDLNFVFVDTLDGVFSAAFDQPPAPARSRRKRTTEAAPAP